MIFHILNKHALYVIYQIDDFRVENAGPGNCQKLTVSEPIKIERKFSRPVLIYNKILEKLPKVDGLETDQNKDCPKQPNIISLKMKYT